MWLFILIRLGGRATRNHLTTWLGFDDIKKKNIMMFCVNSGSYLDTFVWQGHMLSVYRRRHAFVCGFMSQSTNIYLKIPIALINSGFDSCS